jgi:WD40 repeat protein/transcriptional regulator with XRE-family HTH domain
VHGDEIDIDGVQTRHELGRALSALRARAGLTVRELARRIDTPVATLGDYVAGRHLPGPRQLGLYRALLAACGLTDAAEQERWIAALARARHHSDGRVPKRQPPYRGLDPFGPGDADLFFGREAAVAELLAGLEALATTAGPPSPLVVVGPSGSGKSSLLMAGLVPALRTGARLGGRAAVDVRVVHPDDLPALTLGSDGAAESIRRVVVVDQFEEVFAADPDVRAKALASLVAACQRGVLVVLGLRADFFGHAVSEPVLLDALRHGQQLLGPMTEAELRRAITGPAERCGVLVEGGLVDLVLSDLAPGSPPGFAHPPGALPLFSYALLATWQRAERNQLTIADYRAAGGIRGAIVQGAESLFAELSEPEQDAARDLFARLVRVDGSGPPTRRRAPLRELTGPAESDDPRDTASRAVLERFVAARLVTVDAETVGVSHDALLDAWPRLRDWIEEDRAWLHDRTLLADTAASWVEAGRDETLLLRGSRLQRIAESTGPARRAALSPDERDLLDSSLARQAHEQQTVLRHARRTRRLLAAVTCLAAAAVVLATVAVTSSDAANQAKNQALSRQVAIEATELAPTDPSLAAQLAVAAYRISPTVQARSALVGATAGEIPTRLLGPVGPDFVAVGDHGSLLAVARSADDSVAVYRLHPTPTAPLAVFRVGPPAARDFAVALSPDDPLLAVGGTGHRLTVWSLGAPRHPQRLATLGGFTGTIYSIAFSPHGRRLVAGASDGTVREWSLASPRTPSPGSVLRLPGGGAVKAVAYSPDGQFLAAGGGAGTLAVWNTALAGTETPLSQSIPDGATIETVAFNPAGTELATGGDDLALRIWTVSPTGGVAIARPPIAAATSQLFAVAFSPDGHTLAVGAADGHVQLYDTSSWSATGAFETPDPVTSLVFTAGDHHVVTGDSGGATRIWSLPASTTFTEPGRVYYLGYVANDRLLVAGSGGTSGSATIWQVFGRADLERLADIEPPPSFGPVAGAAAANPSGTVVAVADAAARIQLYDTTRPTAPTPLGPPLTGNSPYIEQLGFSPDGRILAASDDSGQVRLWRVTNPGRPQPLPTLRGTTGEVLGFAFDNRGRLLATASTDNRVRLYRIADPHHPRQLATLGGFRSYVYDTAFTPDSRTLIACSADGTIRLWDIADPRHPRLLGDPLTGPTGYVYAIAVSPDGRSLAAAVTTHAVWLWDISDPSHPRLEDTLSTGQGETFAVTFNADGTTLAASGSDDTLHLWQFEPEAAARSICALAGAPVTQSEWRQYVPNAPYQPPCH